MKVVKKYLIFSVFLFFYITILSLLIQQFSIYEKAYDTLSILITNPSIDVVEKSFLSESEIEENKEDLYEK